MWVFWHQSIRDIPHHSWNTQCLFLHNGVLRMSDNHSHRTTPPRSPQFHHYFKDYTDVLILLLPYLCHKIDTNLCRSAFRISLLSADDQMTRYCKWRTWRLNDAMQYEPLDNTTRARMHLCSAVITYHWLFSPFRLVFLSYSSNPSASRLKVATSG